MNRNDPKLKELLATLQAFEIAMFTTVDAHGHIHSRPMQTQEAEEDCDAWFVSSLETTKIAELKANPNVGLIYRRDKDQAYISLAGKAELITDKQVIHDKWKEDWRAWFPDGPDQSDLVLIKVHADEAEWWVPEGGRLSVMFEAARGYVTGTEPKLNPPQRIG